MNNAGAEPGNADNQIRGMAIMALAMLFIPLIDLQGKWLSTVEQVSPAQINAFRFGFQVMAAAIVIVALNGINALKPARPGANMLRGMIMGLTSLVFLIAVKYMPLADAISIFFVEPLILTLLSGLFLREPIGWSRWAAVGVGFVGALLVIQPSFEEFGPVAVLPLIAAVLFSIYMLMSRKLSTYDTPLSMLLMAGIGGFVISVCVLVIGSFLPIEDITPGTPSTISAVMLLIGVGLVATICHFMVTVASRLTRASVLAPFQYLEIVTATIAGLLVFGDFPSLIKWVGIAIIVGSGLFVFWREARLEHAPVSGIAKEPR